MKLKPCPFCGAIPESAEDDGYPGQVWCVMAACPLGIQGAPMWLEAWNTRAIPDLKWTTTPPTVPGWYWINDPNSTRAKMGTDFKYVVRYEMFDIEEWLPKVADREIKWAGPIPAPEEA